MHCEVLCVCDVYVLMLSEILTDCQLRKIGWKESKGAWCQRSTLSHKLSVKECVKETGKCVQNVVSDKGKQFT